MSNYYVNRNEQPNGDHEVHTDGCSWMPAAHNRINLGDFSSCHSAVNQAKNHYVQVNGCYYCANECHTS